MGPTILQEGREAEPGEARKAVDKYFPTWRVLSLREKGVFEKTRVLREKTGGCLGDGIG